MCVLIVSSLTLFKNQEPLGAAALFAFICFMAEDVLVLLSLFSEQSCVRRQMLSPVIIFASKELDLLFDGFGNKTQE